MGRCGGLDCVGVSVRRWGGLDRIGVGVRCWSSGSKSKGGPEDQQSVGLRRAADCGSKEGEPGKRRMDARLREQGSGKRRRGIRPITPVVVVG